MKRTLSLTLVCLLLLTWACSENFAPPQSSPVLFRNDTLPFPRVSYNSVKAYTFDLSAAAKGEKPPFPGNLAHAHDLADVAGRELSPARRADLRVGLALPPDSIVLPQSQAFQSRHAIVFASNSTVVASLQLSFDCLCYRFEPATAHRLGPNNLHRLRQIFE